MHVIFHFLISLLAGIGLVLVLKGNSFAIIILFVILGGVIIDIDHLVYYGIKGFGTQQDDYKTHNPHFYFMHTIEFLIIVGIAAYFYKPFIFFFFGVFLHYLCDLFVYLAYYGTNFSWLKYWSVIYYFSF